LQDGHSAATIVTGRPNPDTGLSAAEQLRGAAAAVPSACDTRGTDRTKDYRM
jgi:hypothetical protein